jgi:hypothetical protein
MQESGGHQQLAIFGRNNRGDATCLASDRLDMQPAVTQRCDQPFGRLRCPCLQVHGATIACLLDRAQAAVLAA